MALQAAKDTPRRQVACAGCGRELKSAWWNQRFCSDACRFTSWAQANRPSKRAADGKYRRANKTKVAARKKTYAQANKTRRKASWQARWARRRSNGGSFTIRQWFELCAKYGWRCLACRRMGVKLTVDHVVPVSLGGSSDISNIQPLCMTCNVRKGVKIIDYRPLAVIHVN